MPTEEQLSKLKDLITEAETAIAQAQEEIRLAEVAGIEMPDRKKEIKDLDAKIKRIKRAYGIG